MENTRQFGRIEAVAVGDGDVWIQPNLGILAAAFDWTWCGSRGRPSFE
jgi:hypothetical protein